MAKPQKNSQYVVAWTISKPEGATSVQMSAGSLVDAVTFARDLWTRASEARHGIDIRVINPVGAPFMYWSTAPNQE